jgi:hypothetical protein
LWYLSTAAVGDDLMRGTVGRVILIVLLILLALGLPGCWLNCRTGEWGEHDESALSGVEPPPAQTTTTTQSQSATPGAPSVSSASTSSATAGPSGVWLLSSKPEGWDDYNPDWHVILAGSAEAGTLSIPEDKTATGTYAFDGETLTIDITRKVGDRPQKFRYEFDGYVGETLFGTVLIGRIAPDEPEWQPPRPARAER